MINFIKTIASYFSYETIKNKYEQELDLQLSKLEENDDAEEKDILASPDAAEIPDLLTEKKCFRTKGKITALKSNHGIIDTNIVFDIALKKDFPELKVGLEVVYLAYKPSENISPKVMRIEEICGNFWDDNVIQKENEEPKTDDVKYYKIHQRCIPGMVTDRYENYITVDTDQEPMNIDLDSIIVEFRPQLGDRVYLDCEVQTNELYSDLAGQVIEVVRIHPMRKSTIEGRITNLNNQFGIVERQYFFNFDCLKISYKPSIGDTVKITAIESEQDGYSWRCVEVIPLRQAVEKKNIVDNGTILRSKNARNDIKLLNELCFTFKDLDEFEEQELILKNDSNDLQIINRSFFIGKKCDSQLLIVKPKLNDRIEIIPGATASYTIKAKARVFGHSLEKFIISLENGIKIASIIKINVGNDDNNQIQEINKENKAKKDNSYAEQVWSRKYHLVSGVGAAFKPKFVKYRIDIYEVPTKLRKAVLSAKNIQQKRKNVEEIRPCIGEQLTFINYNERFQTLLYVEEIAYFISMRKFDRERAHFSRENEYLALEIENLSEQRPSLVIGDSVRASCPWAENDNNRTYEGIIHKVLFDKVLLKFNHGFQSRYNGEDYKLEFFYSRYGFRKQHYATEKIVNTFTEEWLFPTKITLNQKIQLAATLDEKCNLFTEGKTDAVQWYNKSLNSVQKQAIKNILRGETRPMPYIIFGPPGTGKTVTMIETILQLVTLMPNSRLLVATPTNSTADLIATRLIESNVLKPGDFIRLVSYNLIENDLIPDYLKPYCATTDITVDGAGKNNMIVTESGITLRCQSKHLGRHRITIGTCSTLGTFLQMNFRKGHFTHVLIDEAGQCVEPDVMTVLVQVHQLNGQIILAGDPMQLGPVIMDKHIVEQGLETSFLVRLLNRLPYRKDLQRYSQAGFDPRLVTKLIYNYRALPSILKLYNNLFYDSELRPMVNETEGNEITLLKSLNEIFPESNFRPQSHGVFFYGIRGTNRQDSDSPSWYNSAEAKSVFLFILKLYKANVPSTSIGIISPYQKQIKVLRNIFVEADIILPKIGSVEQFQGQERDIIIVSTVRSQRTLINVDLIQALGFVQSPQRMNVAISRPRSLLVIFGNPHLLRHDPNWEYLLKYCIQNDSYSGCDLPEDLNLPEDLGVPEEEFGLPENSDSSEDMIIMEVLKVCEKENENRP